MNIYSFLPLSSSFLAILLGSFVFTKNKNSMINISFSLFCLTICFWLFSYSICYLTKSPQVAITFARMACTGVMFIAPTFYHFTVNFLRIDSERKFVYLAYTISLILIPIFFFTPYLLAGTNKFYWGYYSKAGLYHPFYLLFFFVVIIRGFFLLFIAFLDRDKQLSPIRRTQIRYVFFSFAIASVSSIDYIPKYGLEFYPFGFLFMMLFTIVTAYSIVRYHLMAIEILIKKTTLITIGAIIPVTLLYIGLSYIQPILSPILGPIWLFMPVGLSFVVGYGLYRFIKFILRMNEADLSKKFAYRPMLEKEAERTARARDVREMATFIVRDVSSFTRLDHTAVFILNEQKNAYSLTASVYRKKDRPKLEPGLLLSIHSPLVAFLKDEKKPAVYGQIMHDLQNKELTTHERKFLESVESEMAILGAEICVPSFCEDEMVGIMNLGNKLTSEIFTVQDLQAFQTLANQTGRAISGLLLKNEKIRLIVSSQKSLLETLEARDHYTRGHTERVSQYSLLLGNKLERLIHSIPNSISALNWTAQLHDLGKVGISDSILLKPAALTDEEFAKIKEHPTRGIEILGPLKEWFGDDIIQGVVHHHENFDGTGYPDKQKGDSIHIFARIIRVADAFDAMTTDRPYRKGLSIEEAMAEIKKFRKVQFDPVIADAFIELYNDGVLKKIMDELKKKYG